MAFSVALLALLAATQNPRVDASMHLEYGSLEAATPFEVVLKLDVEKPWHVYWMNPGDSGVPTTVKWTLPGGWKAEPLRFPTPQKFVTSSGTAYGHEGEVFFTARIVPDSKATGPFTIGADIAWLACKETCIPGSAKVNAQIELGSNTSKIITSAFDEAVATHPEIATPFTLKALKTGNGFALQVGGEYKSAYFFSADGDAVSSAEPQPLKTISNGIELSLAPSEYAKEAPTRLQGVLVLTKADAKPVGYEIDVPIEP